MAGYFKLFDGNNVAHLYFIIFVVFVWDSGLVLSQCKVCVVTVTYWRVCCQFLVTAFVEEAEYGQSSHFCRVCRFVCLFECRQASNRALALAFDCTLELPLYFPVLPLGCFSLNSTECVQCYYYISSHCKYLVLCGYCGNTLSSLIQRRVCSLEAAVTATLWTVLTHILALLVSAIRAPF